LFFNGARAGLRSLDALDAYPDGRIAISTTGNQSIGGTYLRHQNAYLFDSGTFTLAFDSREPGIASLDAMSLPDGKD